jgi:hypothetical protein
MHAMSGIATSWCQDSATTSMQASSSLNERPTRRLDDMMENYGSATRKSNRVFATSW